jgi:DnaJ-class molecular chaperone
MGVSGRYWTVCEKCKGSGSVRRGIFRKARICPICRGDGRLPTRAFGRASLAGMNLIVESLNRQAEKRGHSVADREAKVAYAEASDLVVFLLEILFVGR